MLAVAVKLGEVVIEFVPKVKFFDAEPIWVTHTSGPAE